MASPHPTQSFFDMLQDMRPRVGADQRSPGPQHYLASPPSADDRSSPKGGRRKLHKLWGGKQSGLVAGRPGEECLAEEPSRHRRRAFAHYDCQSVSANLSYAATLRALLAKRRNTATGASAASVGRGSGRAPTPDTGPPEDDPGDGLNNDLVQSCPFFRNEVGGEEERVVCLSRRRGGGLHRPSLACGLAVLEFGPSETHWTGTTCPYSLQARPIETVDQGAHYYRHHFYAKEHQNWLGMDDSLGPVAISVRRERVEPGTAGPPDTLNNGSCPAFRYRLIIRTSELLTLRGSILEDAIPNIKPNNNSKTYFTKEVLDYVAPEVQLSCLRLGVSGAEDTLLKLDEQGVSRQYKVGVMYCKAGQSTEEQMYNNQEEGPPLTEFLDAIGQRVRLNGFDKYRAGLDNKTDSTGHYSVYAQHQDCEIMFHVSTLLPFTPNNRQQLLRKRHIGNDIVTIVFQEPGALPFTPKVIRSQFQHVFIVVRAINPCTDNTHYSVSVTRSKEVPVFGPPIPEGGTFPKSKAFTDFLLAKVINAENAAHRSEKFATMATRTRQEYLKDLVNNYTTTTVVETSQKFSMLSFSSKKKERWRPRFLPDSCQRGALCWQVLLDDCSLSSQVDCFLAVSSDSVVLIEEASREIIFSTPCNSVLGWSTNTNSLRLYYHQGECISVHMKEGGDRDELMEVVVRLRSVTEGSVAQELSLKRNPLGQLGFHVQPDGVVTQVEHKGLAWLAGLRQAARLVEICKVAVSTLSHDQMIDLLKTSVAVTVTIIPPQADGSIRKGCSEQVCRYNSSFEGDYENVNNQDSRLNKTARQQAVCSSKRYERSFSPPRSSNSSGYGTGSSSKSFTAGERFINIEGSRSGWSEPEPQEQPPPVPARLSSSANYKNGNYLMLEGGNHDFKVGEVVTTCLMKAERSHELRRNLEHHYNNNNQSVSEYVGLCCDVPLKSSSLSLESGSRVPSITASDDHSTDTSSTSDRLLAAFPSEDDLSGGSSPAGLRRSRTTGSMSVRTESPRSGGGSRDGGEARLRPAAAHRQTHQRNSATLSTLQQDLIRLINPDSESDSSPPANQEVKVKVCESLPDVRKCKWKDSMVESPRRERPERERAERPERERPERSERLERSERQASQEVIVTTARPATVISTSSSSPRLNNSDRSSVRVSKTVVNKCNSGGGERGERQDREDAEPAQLISSLDLGITHHLNSNYRREEELTKQVCQLEGKLSRETMRRLSLEEEVRSLREENRRLQQESQSAAQQLRRFTEWFFQTIDKH